MAKGNSTKAKTQGKINQRLNNRIHGRKTRILKSQRNNQDPKRKKHKSSRSLQSPEFQRCSRVQRGNIMT